MGLEALSPIGDMMSVRALAHLITWATSPRCKPLAILYGEGGSGKTVISQRVTHNLRAMSNSGTLRWTPHYFPLKNCAFAGTSIPTLEEILTESIRRHWVGETNLPTGRSLLAEAKNQPTLFILDGFEWLADQWTAVQRQTLMHELLKLVPHQTASGEWSGPYAGNQAKVLLTLRPEYRSLVLEQCANYAEELLLHPL